MIVYLSMIDTPEDRSKFERLYIEYRDVMYHVAFKILQNEQDAEDAVHQAFLKIAEKIEKVDGTICARTQGYMITIVENKAIDMYRYKQKHQTLELRDDDAGLIIEYNGPNMLTKCMAKLPAKYRTVLLLRHYHGFSPKEIAKKMGTSEANVKKIDHRAKLKLRALCEKEGIL